MRMYKRGKILMAGLAAVSVYGFFVTSLCVAHVAFNVRLIQDLNEL